MDIGKREDGMVKTGLGKSEKLKSCEFNENNI